MPLWLARIYRFVDFLFRLLKEVYWDSDVLEFKLDEAPKQQGRVWLVTGSTAGIGSLVAESLLKLGAHVWITARSEAKAEEHVKVLKDKVGASAKIDYIIVDYSDLTTIKPGVAKFLASGSPLHGIVHNAGVVGPASIDPLPKTTQGFELHLGTNAIAPWLVQKLLDPVLLKTTSAEDVEGRIVWVSSMAFFALPWSAATIAQNPIQKGNNATEYYSISKTVNALQAYQWTKLHPDANVKSVIVHPGLIQSSLTRNLPANERKFIADRGFPTHYGAAVELAGALNDVPNNAYVAPWGKLGKIRGDIKTAGTKDLAISHWLDDKVAPYQ